MHAHAPMILLGAGAVAIGLFAYNKRNSNQNDSRNAPAAANLPLTPFYNVSTFSTFGPSHWVVPRAGDEYVDQCRNAAIRNSLPLDLITRMAWEESRFNADVRGRAGEVGILQIIPRLHPGVDAHDPDASIDYCAEWVRSNRAKLHSLPLAVASWNAGTARARQGWAKLPATTKTYVTEILHDAAPGELAQ